MPKIPMPSKAMSAKLSDPASWVDRYGDALFQYARGRVATRELAEDLVQDTFLAAFRHRTQYDGKSSFGTWLVAILRRKIVDHYRRAGRTPELSAESLSAFGDPFTAKGKWTTSSCKWRTSPSEMAENAEFWTVFQQCMSELPAHLAQAFQMRELGVVSVDDASRLTGVTPKNLAVRLHRARLLLRQCLDTKWFRSERGGET
jgi:RNA polymerase sigma-70 factor (ECF subfamily)